ncbi:M56 family metallopeptidase [Lentzea sp. NPDC005914]|uniref:M56 family metallopeptidase n=1 Tax=Lentzea sp. NPDC005914 TaxID=3154572 RepID=UPI00340E2019
MILALALLAGAVLAGVVAPRFLHRLTTSRIPPAIVMTCWFLTSVGVLLTAFGGVALLFVPGHGPTQWLLDRFHGCWSALTHGGVPQLDDLFGTLGLMTLLTLVVRLGIGAIQCRSNAMSVHKRQLDLLRLAARREPGPVPLLWLDHDKPLAYSVAGRPPFVVVTTGLSKCLSPIEVDAVLAHEHAHLRGRHHVLTGLAEAAAWAFPFLPLMRQAPAAIRVLVEMAADSVASAQYGSHVVRSALLRMGTDGSPRGALAIADDDVEPRLHQLERVTRRRSVLRVSGLLATGVVAAAMPAVLGFGLLAATTLVSCPLLDL